MNERLTLVDAGMMGKAEFRMWYFGETREQAEKAIQSILDEQTAQQMAGINALLPTVPKEPQV